MKAQFTEHEGCFSIDLQAENMQDAALLVRLGTNATSELRHLSTVVNQCGTFESSIVIAKRKQATSVVQKP